MALIDRWWPVILYHFGMRPWELRRLTRAQLARLCREAEHLNRPPAT